MKVSRLERAIGSLLDNGKLTPALDTLQGSPNLAGAELDEFVVAAETLAERIKNGGKPVKNGGMVRPWL